MNVQIMDLKNKNAVLNNMISGHKEYGGQEFTRRLLTENSEDDGKSKSPLSLDKFKAKQLTGRNHSITNLPQSNMDNGLFSKKSLSAARSGSDSLKMYENHYGSKSTAKSGNITPQPKPIVINGSGRFRSYRVKSELKIRKELENEKVLPEIVQAP